jgi:membrane fusion protein, multidrug efflux system
MSMSNSMRAETALLIAMLAISLGTAEAAPAAPPGVITVGTSSEAQRVSFDGVVETVRKTSLAVQVAGAIVEIRVKAGDRVSAGQILMRIDARAANQGSAASDAQVTANQAGLDVARKDWERQQKLFAKGYISQAAFDRSEAQFKAAESQLAAQQALAAAAHTQSGFYVVQAPYAGVIAELPVSTGDIALPGKPLATLYDPASLRVSASLPQSTPLDSRAAGATQVELPGMTADQQWITPRAVHLMPVMDAATHTMELRLDLPPGLHGVAPGMFARAWLTGARPASSSPRIWIPTTAVVRRAELTAAYVLDGESRPLLRQIRIGEIMGARTEILAGLTPGDRLVADPHTLEIPRAVQP